MEGREKDDIAEEVVSVEEKDGVKTVGIARLDPDDSGKLIFHRRREVSEKGILATSVGKLDRPRVDLKLPHKDGQTWAVDDLEETATAHGPKEVKVPVGTYQAIRVEYRKQGDPKSKPLRTYWYAPHIGIVKVINGDFVLEMKAFAPAKD